MAQRVTAIFRTREAAEEAARALVERGADRDQISLMLRDEGGAALAAPPAPDGAGSATPAVDTRRSASGHEAGYSEEYLERAGAAVIAGSATTILAGLGIGLLAMTVPGIGPMVIGGAAAGAAIVGGLAGGLVTMGLEERHAQRYEEHVRSGNVLLTALVPNIDLAQVRSTLAAHGAEDVSFTGDTSA